jgi:hypothetical protein
MAYERQILKIAEIEVNGKMLEFHLWFSRDTATNYAVWDSMFIYDGVQIHSTPLTGADRDCIIEGERYRGTLITTDIKIRNPYHMGAITKMQ